MARYEPYNYNIGVNPSLPHINQTQELMTLDLPVSTTPSSFMLFSNGDLVDARHNNSHFSPNLLHGEDFFFLFLFSSGSSAILYNVLKLNEATNGR